MYNSYRAPAHTMNYSRPGPAPHYSAPRGQAPPYNSPYIGRYPAPRTVYTAPGPRHAPGYW